MKLPALHFYVGDWRKDMGVQALTFHDRGIWFELLCMMHESEQRGLLLLKGKALSDDVIARLLGLDLQVCKKTIQTLLDTGVADRCPTSGALMSRRMVRDEEIRSIRKTVGKLGGNPKLVNQNKSGQDNQTPNQKPESEDEDESTQELAGEIYELYPKKARRPKAILAIRRCLKDFASDFLRERTAAYAKAVNGSDMQYVPHPATWFNGHGFNDDPSTWVKTSSGPVINPQSQLKEIEEELKRCTEEQHQMGDHFVRVAKPGMEEKVKQLREKRKELKEKIRTL